MEKQLLVKEICPTTAQAWVKAGALMVDVREKEEAAKLAFDVPDLIHIPLSDFEDRYAEIPKDKDVVVVCRAGIRSLRAAAFLINHGWDREKVVNMEYGMVRWVEKGFPVKGTPSVLPLKKEVSGCCDPVESPADGVSKITKSKRIAILDPALCCSTGVCGPEVNDALVQTAAHVKWLRSLGYEVSRHNLARDAVSFRQYPEAVKKLQKEGAASLPYILINDELVMTGKYPSKPDWLRWLEDAGAEASRQGLITNHEPYGN